MSSLSGFPAAQRHDVSLSELLMNSDMARRVGFGLSESKRDSERVPGVRSPSPRESLDL